MLLSRRCNNVFLRRPGLILLALLHSVWIGVFVMLHYGTSSSILSTPVFNVSESTDSSPIIAKIVTTTLPSARSYVPLLLIFTKAERNSALLTKLIRCLQSLVQWRTPVNLIIVSDKKSFDVAEAAIKRNVTSDKARIKLSFFNLADAVLLAQDLINPIKQHLNVPESSYSQTAFFLSIVIHRILPFHNRVLYVDIDVIFQSDIAELFAQFANFSSENLLGLAHERQPHRYRAISTSTAVGSTLPNGHPGYNDGVVMLDLNRMRRNKFYESAVDAKAIAKLLEKYQFDGDLQDQDLFTLLSLEHQEWFYTIPCQWNRQLCVNWKSDGPNDVLKDNNFCAHPVKIYHGKCKDNYGAFTK